MKAITLHQPEAMLVALGVKTIEINSWPAPKGLIGQRLVIHASARRPPVYGGSLGMVVASAVLTDCVTVPARWTWLLEDVKPTTKRCPACWGRCGTVTAGVCVDIDGDWWHKPWAESCSGCSPCFTCDGKGSCAPIPARGDRRVWEWTP